MGAGGVAGGGSDGAGTVACAGSSSSRCGVLLRWWSYKRPVVTGLGDGATVGKDGCREGVGSMVSRSCYRRGGDEGLMMEHVFRSAREPPPWAAKGHSGIYAKVLTCPG